MEFQKHNIEKLLIELLSAFNRGPESVLLFFAEDASIQYPYSDRNSAVMNRKQYCDHLSMVLQKMHSFQSQGHKLYATDELGTYWATVDLQCTIKATEKIYLQSYILRFCLNEYEKITQYFEYGNPLKFSEAIKP